jgi:hyperosmotically inducible protein
MRIANTLVLGSSLIFAAGCSYPDRQARTYSTQPYTGQVISSPAYSATTATTPTYTYSDPSAAAVSNQVYNDLDRALANSIRQQLNGYPDVAGLAQNIHVDTRNAVVTLSGTVPSERDRDRIIGVVRNVGGVSSVNNQLQVSAYPTGRVDQGSRIYSSEQAPLSSNAAAATGEMFSLHVQNLTPEDRNLGERILEGLRTDTVLAAVFPHVNIHVQNGVIVLRGSVQNEQQRQTIVSAVQRAAGTNNVRDELRIGG